MKPTRSHRMNIIRQGIAFTSRSACRTPVKLRHGKKRPSPVSVPLGGRSSVARRCSSLRISGSGLTACGVLPMMFAWLPGTAAMHCRTRRAVPKVGRETGDGSRNLRAARNRWLNRVSEIGILAADETQVDQRELMGEGLTRDDIVEQGQANDGEAPAPRIGKA